STPGTPPRWWPARSSWRSWPSSRKGRLASSSGPRRPASPPRAPAGAHPGPADPPPCPRSARSPRSDPAITLLLVRFWVAPNEPGGRAPPDRKDGRNPMRKNRTFALGATVLALAVVAAACSKSGGGGSKNTPSSSPTGTITVGVSGNFAENQIVAQMYAQVLAKAGYTVKTKLDLD